MESNVVARIARYGHLAATSRCPDCGSPLVVTYQESQLHGLELALTCAADCGYARKQRKRDRIPTSSTA